MKQMFSIYIIIILIGRKEVFKRKTINRYRFSNFLYIKKFSDLPNQIISDPAGSEYHFEVRI